MANRYRKALEKAISLLDQLHSIATDCPDKTHAAVEVSHRAYNGMMALKKKKAQLDSIYHDQLVLCEVTCDICGVSQGYLHIETKAPDYLEVHWCCKECQEESRRVADIEAKLEAIGRGIKEFWVVAQ